MNVKKWERGDNHSSDENNLQMKVISIWTFRPESEVMVFLPNPNAEGPVRVADVQSQRETLQCSCLV